MGRLTGPYFRFPCWLYWRREATPLHFACRRDQVQCALILLHKGANINACDVDGNLPLHHCAANGHERCAKVVMWHRPETLQLNAVNNNGDSALHIAARWGFMSIVRMILGQGALRDVRNTTGKTPMQCALNRDIAAVIADKAPVDVNDFFSEKRMLPTASTIDVGQSSSLAGSDALLGSDSSAKIGESNGQEKIGGPGETAAVDQDVCTII